jgi:hypothetical protein
MTSYFHSPYTGELLSIEPLRKSKYGFKTKMCVACGNPYPRGHQKRKYPNLCKSCAIKQANTKRNNGKTLTCAKLKCPLRPFGKWSCGDTALLCHPRNVKALEEKILFSRVRERDTTTSRYQV